MVIKLLKRLIKTAIFLRYRFQYLINYIIIGVLSVAIEIIIAKYLIAFIFPFFLKVTMGFIAGVMLAFILNARLNFRVPKSKNRRTFFLFVSISIIAFILNLILIELLKKPVPLDYSYLRYITATIVFALSYTAHRKITFDFVKNVGIAVYLNRKGNVSGVYSKIKYYADFVHIDLIDKSFDKDAPEVELSLIKEINKTWGLKKILHLMSKNPSIWIKKLYRHVNVIIFHSEIDEPINQVISLCRSYNKKVGICLKTDSKIKDIVNYLPRIDFIQLMGINELGKSGQYLNPESIDRLKELNQLKKKYNFKIIFDGGVKPTNVGRINAKYIVSASSLLSSQDPIKSFLELKTSSRYRNIKTELKEYLIKKIKDIVENSELLISGNIVGSFSRNNGLEGINDIDIVLIANKLTKENFTKTILSFEKLKKETESNYGYKVVINPSLGPLKFNKDNIVFHLMIYGINSHMEHCKKSPFTCFDWQLSKLFFKKPLSEIYKVRLLQPSYFLNARRSAKEYLSDILSNQLSYREYKFVSNRVIEEKKYKVMDSRDKIEFSYHITRFLVMNFLKLYYKNNKNYELNEMLNIYFNLFPANEKTHKIFIKNLIKAKEKRNYTNSELFVKNTELFLKDFEQQFNEYFYNNSREIVFFRHAQTKINEENEFIGQKTNPDIIIPNREITATLKKLIENYGLFFSSPMQRCKNTLNLLTNKNIVIDNRLNEIDYGIVDGKDLSYLSANYPVIIEEWEYGNDPKFPEGESTKDVFNRAMNFINSIKTLKENKIAVCTHNVFLRCLIGAYFKIPLKDWHRINIPFLKPINFILTKDNRFYIELDDNLIEEIFKNI